MNIIFIGAGNLATHLAQALFRNGHNIAEVYSRTLESASELAGKVESVALTDIKQLSIDADLYIVALSDNAIDKVISELEIFDIPIVHTAGSVDMSVFKDISNKYGVFYPLQTFSKSKPVNFKEIPIFIESIDSELKELLYNLADDVSEKVYEADFATRKGMHLSAVFACNFVNHMFAISEDLLKKNNIQFDVLKPLLKETTEKAFSGSPGLSQTGPAIREDHNIMNEHIKMLKNRPDLAELYKFVSQNIIEFHKKENI